jgi:hypothetical protein
MCAEREMEEFDARGEQLKLKEWKSGGRAASKVCGSRKNAEKEENKG